MDFSAPPSRPRAESIVPMINVVFLLLIFFLMTSNLATPEPFTVTPPDATTSAEPEAQYILYIDKTGKLSFEGKEDTDALAAILAVSATDTSIQVRADAQLEAVAMARTLSDLTSAGLSQVELIVTSR